MTNEDVIDKLEGLKAFYAGLHPELANTYVEALDTAINAVRFTFDPDVVYDTDLFSRRLRELMENVQSSAWGKLPANRPGYFIQAAGDGMRSIVRAIGDTGVKDAESEFLIGFIGNTLDGLNNDSLYKLHKFFGRKEEEKKEAENNG